MYGTHGKYKLPPEGQTTNATLAQSSNTIESNANLIRGVVAR
jgi:hypothetical protein